MQQDIILTQIGMHEAALVVHKAHGGNELAIQTRPVFGCNKGLGILQPRTRPTVVIPEKLHYQNVVPEFNRCRCPKSCIHKAFEVPHLLFCPEPHHFSRIMSGITMAEAEFTRHISIAVLKHKNTSFVYFDRHTSWRLPWFQWWTYRIVYIGFFACADAPIYLGNELATDHFRQDKKCTRIEHLL